jgi:hypothetical protein
MTAREADDENELDPVEQLLRRARPGSPTAWRHQLLRELQAGPLAPPRPPRLWTLILSSAGAGSALLLVGALLI